jgi:DNA-binding transcriptional LysR family regulator
LTAVKFSIEKWLRDFEVDIALIQSPSKSPDFQMEYFAVDNLVLFIHPTHPLAKKKELELEDLAKTPLIIRDGRGTSHKVLQHLKQRGLKLNVALRCQSPDGVKAAVRRKMGVGILFSNQVEEEVKRKDFKVLKIADLPKLVGHSYIVHSKSKPLSSAANDFLTVLQSMKTRISSESRAA